MTRVGDKVVAQTSMGFWIRGTVLEVREGRGARVRFGGDDTPGWLPRTQGIGDPVEWCGPERIAAYPATPPTAPPPVGATVIALWDRRRFFVGQVAAIRGAGADAIVEVDFRSMERLPFTVDEVLPIGAPAPSAVAALEADALFVGASVVVVGGDGAALHPGWIERHGTGLVYVRYPVASHGHWLRPHEVRLEGRAAPRLPPKPVGRADVGARVVARWTDAQLYGGLVAATRETVKGRELEIRFDDGSERWTPEARVYVTEVAGPPVPQATRAEPLDLARLVDGAVVAARAGDGIWRKGILTRRAGREAWIDFDEVPNRKGTSTTRPRSAWVKLSHAAVPPAPEDRSFPARGTPVVVVTRRAKRRGYELLGFEPGRAGAALGDRLEVRLESQEARLAPRHDVWLRARLPDSIDPAFEPGAHVLAMRTPDEVELATVQSIGDRKMKGLVRLQWKTGLREWVDPARLEPAPPPEPEPEPPSLEDLRPEPAPLPPPEPEPEDLRRSLLLQVLSRWIGPTDYRDGRLGAAIDEAQRGAQLPVDVGVLGVDVDLSSTGAFVTVTAATGTGADPLPPPTPALMRFANTVRSLFARAEDSEAAKARDLAWAHERVHPNARVVRAGGALAVEVVLMESPEPGTLVEWAHTVHDRLFDPYEAS